VNGFSKAAYWTKDAIIKHAQKHSKSYGVGSEIWRKNFDEMAEKTALRNLLGHYGMMSVELQSAVAEDMKDDRISYSPELSGDVNETTTVEGAYTDVNLETGEVNEPREETAAE
jgi:recombination protein RecT